MSTELKQMSEAVQWRLMVNAAKKGAEAAGYSLERVPGRGLSNVYAAKKNGKVQLMSIRTTRDRWIAFPPLEGGKKWKTLDDVELVLVATVDSKETPQKIEVYIFPANDVRQRFSTSYAARAKAGHLNRDNFGMWVALDVDQRGIASSVGSGIIEKYKCVATYPINTLLADTAASTTFTGNNTGSVKEPWPNTIAAVMEWARQRVSEIAGVELGAVKLDLKLEY